MDRLLVETLSIELAAFNARDLSGDQGSTIFKILRSVLGPVLDLPVVRSQGFHVCDLLI